MPIKEPEIPKVDFEIRRNTDWVKELAWQDASVTPPVPIPMTGWRLRMQIRMQPGAPLLATLDTTTTGIEITDALKAEFTLELSRELTRSLPNGCEYDLMKIDEDGKWDCLFEGKLTFVGSITED